MIQSLPRHARHLHRARGGLFCVLVLSLARHIGGNGASLTPDRKRYFCLSADDFLPAAHGLHRPAAALPLPCLCVQCVRFPVRAYMCEC